MIVLKPRIKALFDSGIKQLAKDGVDPTAEEIVWLYSLAERAIKSNSGEETAFFNSPIKISGIYLYPLTIQASIWIEHYARKWWRNDERKDLWSVAYAMAHAQKPKAFEKLTTRTIAETKLIRFMFRHLFVSQDRLRQAVTQILGDYDYVKINEKGEKLEPTEWGETICLLCATYHLSPEIFLCDYSIATILEMIRKAPTSEGVKSDDNIRAFIDYRETLKYIAEKHKYSLESSVIHV